MLLFSFALLLVGFCNFGNSATLMNVTADNQAADETSATSTTTPSSTVSGDAQCISYVSTVPGQLLSSRASAVLGCQCSSSSSCPDVNFLTGEEYIFVEERKLDLSPESCGLQYKFQVRQSYLQVGRQRVTITCALPGTDEVFGLFDVYIDYPDPENSSTRSRLSVFMILAIVLFVLLALAFFGFLFWWQIRRSRRRAERNALFRSPFVQPQTNCAFAAHNNPTFDTDSPPSYNEATYAASGHPMEGLTVQEKLEKLTEIKQNSPDQTVTRDPELKPDRESIPSLPR